jgi:hypothetical protein
MRRSFLIVIVFAAIVALPCRVMGQTSSTAANVGVDAKVIAPITITNTSSTPLNFGTVSRSSITGTVTVATDGSRTYSGGASILTSSAATAAPFTVTGENSANYNITLPSNTAVVLTRVGGSETMSVTAFTHNSSLVLSSTGSAAFSVGATLNLGAEQVAGTYQGSFSLTVAYQ